MKLSTKTCYKHTNFFVWPVYKVNKAKHHHLRLRFLEDSIYVLREKDGSVDPDQKDWCKMGGISYSPYNASRKNSVMGAYRWDEERKVFETAFYWHPPTGEKNYVNSNVEFLPGDLVDIYISELDNGVRITIVNPRTKQHSSLLINNVYASGRKRVINAWFGGNEQAQNTMRIHWGYEKLKLSPSFEGLLNANIEKQTKHGN